MPLAATMMDRLHAPAIMDSLDQVLYAATLTSVIPPRHVIQMLLASIQLAHSVAAVTKDTLETAQNVWVCVVIYVQFTYQL